MGEGWRGGMLWGLSNLKRLVLFQTFCTLQASKLLGTWGYCDSRLPIMNGFLGRAWV